MHSHFSHTDSVTLFGLLFVASLGTCWYLARRNASAIGIHPSHLDLLFPLILVGGIAGAWGLSLVMPGDRLLAGEAMQVDIRLRLFGVVLFGAAVAFIYSRLNGMAFRSLLDTLALPAIAALVVHRVGCFLAGCCWGDVSVAVDPALASDMARQVQTLPWLSGDWVVTGVRYDPGTLPYEQHVALGLIGPGATQSLPVHPVQLYELGMLVIAYLALRRIPLQQGRPGTIAVATAVTYAVVRFVLEYLRADGALWFGGLTVTQVQCIGLAAITLIVAKHSMIPAHAARHQHP